MVRIPVFLFFVGLTLVVIKVEAQTFFEKLDTSSGYCHSKQFGKIKVGETGYDDVNCQRGECSEGLLSGAACGYISGPPGCTTVKGPGHYPDCCPQLGENCDGAFAVA